MAWIYGLHTVGLHRLRVVYHRAVQKRYGFIYVNKHDDGTGDMSRHVRRALTGTKR